MAYQRRRYLPQDDYPHGGGASLVKGILNLLGGGSPTYEGEINSAASEGGTALSSGENAPVAKPGRWTGGYNIFDKILGKPNIGESLNNQAIMDQLEAERALQNQIALQKAIIPLQTNEAIRQFGAQSNLKSLAADAVEQRAAENRALFDPELNVPTNFETGEPRARAKTALFVENGIPRIGASIDPVLIGQARAKNFAPQYAESDAATSLGRLQAAQNTAALPNVNNFVTSGQNATIAGNRLTTGKALQDLDILSQGYPSALKEAAVKSQVGLEGAQGELGVAGKLPQAKLSHLESQTGLANKQGEYLEGLKTDLTRAQVAAEKERAKPEGQKLREKLEAFGVTLPGTPSGVGGVPITAPSMSTPPAVPQAQTVEGTHYVTNPDGTIDVKIPILLPNGNILPVGKVKRKQP